MSGGATGLEVAIVGMALRVAGAADLDAYWQMIVRGEAHVTRFGEADLLAEGVPASLVRHPDYVPAKPVVPRGTCFDAELFGFTRQEAERLDPKARVFLEVALHALEHAGYAGDPRVSVGVLAGASEDAEWVQRVAFDPCEDPGQQLAGGILHKDFLAQLVAYRLDLRGPAVSIYTACSTSLAAVHLACRSLLVGDCDLALAGGVTVELPLRAGYLWRPGLVHAADGHCRPFDARATGTVFGDGAAAVVLKRLADAIADGDTIHAVLLGTAMNNDGRHKAGFVTPGPEGQAAVIRAALAMAELTGEDIGYVETHGTGTPVGDPVELEALANALATKRPQSCAIGSVKANIGHTHAAAGVAGLIKAALVVREGVLPPLANFEQPNPRIRLDSSPFWVPRAATPWRDPVRRAGVSSFGVGGTNVHAILEAPPPPRAWTATSGPWFVPLSAQTPEALDALDRAARPRLATASAGELDALALTHQLGRRDMSVRRVLRIDRSATGSSIHAIVPALPRENAWPLALLVRLPALPLTHLEHAIAELGATIDSGDVARVGARSAAELVARAARGEVLAQACVAHAVGGALLEHLPDVMAVAGVDDGVLVAAALAGVMEWGAVLAWLAARDVAAPLPPRRAGRRPLLDPATGSAWVAPAADDEAVWRARLRAAPAQMRREGSESAGHGWPSASSEPVRWLLPLDPPPRGWREALATLWTDGRRLEWRRWYPRGLPGRAPSVLTRFADTLVPFPPPRRPASSPSHAPEPPPIAAFRRARPAISTPYRAPETAAEGVVVAAMEALLEIAPIGLDDDFFELGGDSLSATRLARRLESDLGVALDLSALLDEPTAARIARHASEER